MGIVRSWVASLPSSYLENELVGPFFEPAPCAKAGFVGPSPPGGPPEGLLAFYGAGAEAPAVSPMIPPMVATRWDMLVSSLSRVRWHSLWEFTLSGNYCTRQFVGYWYT